jgi:hypothetical protein
LELSTMVTMAFDRPRLHSGYQRTERGMVEAVGTGHMDAATVGLEGNVTAVVVRLTRIRQALV